MQYVSGIFTKNYATANILTHFHYIITTSTVVLTLVLEVGLFIKKYNSHIVNTFGHILNIFIYFFLRENEKGQS